VSLPLQLLFSVEIFEGHTKTSLLQVFVCDDGKKLYNIDDCLTDASELADRRSNKNSRDGIRSSSRWTGDIIKVLIGKTRYK